MGEKVIAVHEPYVAPESMVYAYLMNGSIQGVGDYSSAPHELTYTCRTGRQNLHIERMIVYIEDVGSFPTDKYGYNVVLTNGIHVAVHSADETEQVDLDGGQNIFTNAQWAAVCYDVNFLNLGSGNDSLSVRWTFANAGSPIILKSGEHFTVTLNDDFTGLEAHTFMIQGHYL